MIQRKIIFSVGMSILVVGAVSMAIFKQPDDTIQIGSKRWDIERVSTPLSREMGLSSREFLPSGTGMLFLFPDISPGKHAFWMKGMRFPLDIAWMLDGQVVFIERNVPADSKDIFRPPTDADSVLEVNAGEMEGLRIGDRVE